MGAQRLDFYDFSRPFRHPFSIKFCNQAHLLNCNNSLAKLVFCQIRPLHCGIESALKSMFFQDAIRDPIFLVLFDESMPENSIWGPPSKSSGRQNCVPNHPGGAQRLSKSILRAYFFLILKPTRFQKVARSAQGFLLYDLLCILGPTWPQFYRLGKQFWHRLLHNM